MNRNRRFIIGGGIVLLTLGVLIRIGMEEAMVYFKTPGEIKAEVDKLQGKFLRIGGMVVQGSLNKDLKKLIYRFQITDGTASIPVYFVGVPPDLFSEGKGAIVEGRMREDGVFHATLIMAKHSEEYSPPGKDKHYESRRFVSGKEGNRP
jgi:cytochrome c-type biogenesis protein CcmE